MYEKVNASCTDDCTFAEGRKSVTSVVDATAGMFVVVLLFVLPSKLTFWPFSKELRGEFCANPCHMFLATNL